MLFEDIRAKVLGIVHAIGTVWSRSDGGVMWVTLN